MSINQGLLRYPGLRDFISATFTRTPGIAPSICTVDTPPQASPLPLVGEIEWSFAGNTYEFPLMALDKIEPQMSEDGLVTWRIVFLDRRWIWRETGRISGRYNQSESDVAAVASGNESLNSVLPLADLLQLCLQELGEADAIIDADCNGLTTLFLPVDWDYDRPAEALADLCDRSNNIVTLGLDNRVRIRPNGRGAQLPTQDVISEQRAVDPQEAPAAIIIVSAPNEWQFDLRLDPVGRELDGTVKPIDELSYAPTVNGEVDWSENDFELHNRVQPQFRQIARETVWKWYRVRPGFTLPGPGPTVNALDEILPLLDRQVETYEDEQGRTVRRPPWVWGKFSPLEDKLKSVDQAESKLSNQPEQLYRGGFQIDAENGLIKASTPIVIWEKTKRIGAGGAAPDATGLFVYPPEIYLRIAVTYTEDGYLGVQRTEFFSGLTPGTNPATNLTRYVLANDLQRGVYEDHEARQLVDNLADLEPRAREKWEVTAQEYIAKTEPQSATYAGLVPLEIDGAIAQVSWQISAAGLTTTRASRNREEVFIAPTYRERRLFERLREQQRPKK